VDQEPNPRNNESDRVRWRGANKLVAKIASDLAKPDGLTVVTPIGSMRCSTHCRLRRLPGLGRKTGAKVEAREFKLLRSCVRRRIPCFGRCSADTPSGCGTGSRYRRPAGPPDLEEKSISAEDTFERDLGDPNTLQAQLSQLADRACERLRKGS